MRRCPRTLRCQRCDAAKGKRLRTACGNTTNAVCNDTRCPAYPRVSHAKVTAMPKRGTHDFGYSATARVTCGAGYAGGGTIECKSDGNWTQPPTCEVKGGGCGPLKVDQSDFAVAKKKAGSSRGVGAVHFVQCAEGHEGSRRTTCRNTSEWLPLVACKACAQGKHLNSSSQQCVHCPVLMYSDAVAQAKCKVCDGGEQPNKQRTACEACGDGEATVKKGGAFGSCEACKIGKVPNEGKTECKACELGKYYDAGGCVKCAEANSEANKERTRCICKLGFYNASRVTVRCVHSWVREEKGKKTPHRGSVRTVFAV